MTALTDRRVWPQPGRRPWRVTLPVAVALTRFGAGAARAIGHVASAQVGLLPNGDFTGGSGAGWTCSPGDTVAASPVYDGDADAERTLSFMTNFAGMAAPYLAALP